uniref:Uncharacterized protein n=1 Tax=Arundo donax TaxID=35708 RepID=A0A0A9CHF7_ARUDO
MWQVQLRTYIFENLRMSNYVLTYRFFNFLAATDK